MKILFIINIYSGKRANKNRLWDVISDLNNKGHIVEVYITQKENDAYISTINKAKDYDLILVSGGDGTIHEVTNALMDIEIDIPFGIYPSGTINDFAANFKLDIDYKKNTEYVLKNKLKAFDMGKFNDTYFDYVAGFGAFCDVSFTTRHEDKNRFGNLAYIVKGIGTIGALRPYHLKIEYDDGTLENDYMFGLVLLGKRAAGLSIFDENEALVDDGYFDVILIEFTPNWLELYNYLLGILNPKGKFKYVTRFKTKKLKIETEDELMWTLDGEDGGINKDVTITNIPRCLKIFSE